MQPSRVGAREWSRTALGDAEHHGEGAGPGEGQAEGAEGVEEDAERPAVPRLRAGTAGADLRRPVAHAAHDAAGLQ